MNAQSTRFRWGRLGRSFVWRAQANSAHRMLRQLPTTLWARNDREESVAHCAIYRARFPLLPAARRYRRLRMVSSFCALPQVTYAAWRIGDWIGQKTRDGTECHHALRSLQEALRVPSDTLCIQSQRSITVEWRTTLATSLPRSRPLPDTLSTSDLRGIVSRTFVDITRRIITRFGCVTAMSLAV